MLKGDVGSYRRKSGRSIIGWFISRIATKANRDGKRCSPGFQEVEGPCTIWSFCKTTLGEEWPHLDTMLDVRPSSALHLDKYDLRRIVAGAALALKAWSWQLTHASDELLPGVAQFTEGRGYYKNEDELVTQLKQDVLAGEQALGRKPRVMIMGALGRCGRGACDLLIKAGVPDENLIKWDLDETRDNPGPYKEIVDSDVFINAVSRFTMSLL